MFAADTGDVSSVGTTFPLLNREGLIELDYQFTEESASV
jgi:hypothetical protein